MLTAYFYNILKCKYFLLFFQFAKNYLYILDQYFYKFKNNKLDLKDKQLICLYWQYAPTSLDSAITLNENVYLFKV